LKNSASTYQPQLAIQAAYNDSQSFDQDYKHIGLKKVSHIKYKSQATKIVLFCVCDDLLFISSARR